MGTIIKKTLIVIGTVVACALFINGYNYARLDIRNFDDGARDLLRRASTIRDLARRDYQARALSGMKPNVMNGTVLRLTDMLPHGQVREAPAQPESNMIVGRVGGFEFNQPGEAKLVAAKGYASGEVENGIFRARQRQADYLFNETPLDIPSSDIHEMQICAGTDKATRIIVGLTDLDNPKTRKSEVAEIEKFGIEIKLVGGNRYYTYVIDLRNFLADHFAPDSKLKTFFLVPGDRDDDRIEINFIRFMSVDGRYRKKISGVDYYDIGDESRQTLYMSTTQKIEFAVKVPDHEAVLEFGMAVLRNKGPVFFEIAVAAGKEWSKIYGNSVRKSDGWRDERVNLAPWSGQDVRLLLTARCNEPNVAFWSDPVIYGRISKRFNVFLILEDALRSDHLSFNGYSLVTSKNKDALFAKQGIIFKNAISQSYFTRSSLPSLMTSLLPSATGVSHSPERLGDEYLTLAEIMRHQGFATASFVQNVNSGSAAGLAQGFSQIYDLRSDLAGGTTETSTEAACRGKLIDWLGYHGSQNKFVYLHILDPHGPYAAPPPFDKWYLDRASDGAPVAKGYLDPDFVRIPTALSRRLLYDGEIAHNDSVLAGMLESIKSLCGEEDTLLIFLSDHGEHMGEHGVWDHGPPGFLQTIHAELALVYPSRFKESKSIEETVQLMDVMPTILAMAGIDMAGLLLQGDSLVELMERKNLNHWRNRIVVSEETAEVSRGRREANVSGSFFFQKWHLISAKDLFKGSWRLPPFWRMRAYNFHADSEENDPLLLIVPDFVMRYKYSAGMRSLQTIGMEISVRMSGEGTNPIRKLDPQNEKRLKALGYVR